MPQTFLFSHFEGEVPVPVPAEDLDPDSAIAAALDEDDWRTAGGHESLPPPPQARPSARSNARSTKTGTISRR